LAEPSFQDGSGSVSAAAADAITNRSVIQSANLVRVDINFSMTE
jgi:hypothetical protein